MVFRWGARTLTVSGAGALLVMLGWFLELLPADRPQLVLMVYMALVAGSIVGALAACAAACQMSIGRAFAAGLRAGTVDGSGPDDRGPLRLVE